MSRNSDDSWAVCMLVSACSGSSWWLLNQREVKTGSYNNKEKSPNSWAIKATFTNVWAMSAGALTKIFTCCLQAVFVLGALFVSREERDSQGNRNILHICFRRASIRSWFQGGRSSLATGTPGVTVSGVTTGLVAAGWHFQLFKAYVLVGIAWHGPKIETIVNRAGDEGERIRDSGSKEKKRLN